MIWRILASLLLLLSVLFMPFWVSAILVFGSMIYFSSFWEGVLLFFLSDLLYGVPEARFLGAIFVSTIVSVLFLVLLELFKKRIKFYAR